VTVDVHQETRNLDKYECSRGISARLLGRFQAKLEAELAALAPSSLLDAGCGEGVATAWLAAVAPDASVTGLDGRPDAIAELRDRVPRATAVTGDLYALPFADGEFDVVVCTEVLEHLERPGDALLELVRVADRALLLTVPHEPFFRGANLVRGRYVGRLGSTPGHLNTWGRRGFTALVEPHAAAVRWLSAFPWQGMVVDLR
jgi:2-polyprenyl-3-methyl-5-hydroxy-6-metoxy-1,4-benzoquinol methylase